MLCPTVKVTLLILVKKGSSEKLKLKPPNTGLDDQIPSYQELERIEKEEAAVRPKSDNKHRTNDSNTFYSKHFFKGLRPNHRSGLHVGDLPRGRQNAIITWVMWFVFNSFQNSVPWSQCPLNDNSGLTIFLED
ncbi:unnamed protein product [Boreogadus saida]